MKREFISTPFFIDGRWFATATDQTHWMMDNGEKEWHRCYGFPPLPDAPDPQPSPSVAPTFKVGDVVDRILSLMADVDLWDIRSRRVFAAFGSHRRLAPKAADLNHVRDMIVERLKKITTPAEIEAFERVEKAKGGGE